MDKDSSIGGLVGLIIFIIVVVISTVFMTKYYQEPETIYTVTANNKQIEYSSIDGYSVTLNRYGVCYIFKDGELQEKISGNVSLITKIN